MHRNWTRLGLLIVVPLLYCCATTREFIRPDDDPECIVDRAYIRVKVDGATSVSNLLDEVNGWRNGAPDDIDYLGNETFRLCWLFSVAPGGRESFGADLKNPRKWTELGTSVGGGDDGGGDGAVRGLTECELNTASSPIFELKTAHGLGDVLQVRNPSISEPVRVGMLESALSPTVIGVDNLTYGDAAVEALPWQPISTGNFDLGPLASTQFDIPDGVVGGSPDLVYVRARFGATSDPSPSLGVVTRETLPLIVPAVTQLALALLTLVLFAALMLLTLRAQAREVNASV